MQEFLYDEATDTLGIKTTYDPSALIDQNAAERAAGRQYLGVGKETRLVKIMSLDLGHIEALKNLGYDFFSPDPDERRRCLLYVQQNEPVWMTVDGKPIAQFKQRWV
jgi:hypothetical protein